MHRDFKLNGVSFDDVDALIDYSKNISDSVYGFLISWFDANEFVEVKTSGSTGKPKLIRLKKQHMKNSAVATGAFFNVKENTTALLCLSADYIAGKMMLVRSLTLGWHIDVVESVSNPLSKTDKDYDFSAMVPMQLQKSLSEIHRVKKLIVGGGVVSQSLIHKIQNIKTEVFATYGMTETITHIAVKKLNQFSSKALSSSSVVEEEFYKILPNIKIYIDSRSCLVIEAPKLSDELVVTNDVVALISDKQFQWIGRYDNVINSGGVKLHPEKIEKELAKTISNRFFIIGIPDEILGEKLVLIIEGKEKEINFNNFNLSKYEIPKKIFFLNEFNLTKTGKIHRKNTLNSLNNFK